MRVCRLDSACLKTCGACKDNPCASRTAFARHPFYQRKLRLKTDLPVVLSRLRLLHSRRVRDHGLDTSDLVFSLRSGWSSRYISGAKRLRLVPILLRVVSAARRDCCASAYEPAERKNSPAPSRTTSESIGCAIRRASLKTSTIVTPEEGLTRRSK